MSKKIPTVAIIGQTNAGKSALFNRISRSKTAIVAKEEGTTRDNIISKITFKNSSFWLVDTAGLKDPEDDFEASIQDQINDAINNADLIILAVDGTKYPNNDDKLIAKKALKSKKDVVLAINKCDLKDTLNTSEFLFLGIKNTFRVSAEHNTGIVDLLGYISTHIPKVSDNKTEDSLKIALVGRPNVGKSSLFNTFAKKQQAIVANLSGTTRDINRIDIGFKKQRIEILDTAGVRRPGKQQVGIEKFSVLRTMQAIEESDICLLLVDSTEPHSQFDQKLAGIISDAGKGIILVVTKWDLFDSEDKSGTDRLLANLSQDFNFTPYAPVVLTSSVSGKNVAKILDLCIEIKAEREKKIRTSELNRVLRQAVLDHMPAGLKNTTPKLRYVVQTDTNPPWFVVYGRHLKLLHWSYKRFLDRRFREAFGFNGTPIKFSFREEEKDD